MKTKSIEVQRLLNPAFCGQVILHFLKKYQQYSESGTPYPLVFLILPIILHAETRTKIPSVSKSKFHSWLMQNQSILIDLPERIKQLVPITKQSILLLSYYDSIQFSNGQIMIKKFNPKTSSSDWLDIQDCFKKSENLGKWLVKAGTITTIYSLLGVKP